MTHFWTRSASIALAAAAVAACTTGPQYPTTTDGVAGGPLEMPRPNFPVRQDSAPQPGAADPAPAARPSGGAVESQALPPPPATTAPPPQAVDSRPLTDLTPAEPRTVTQTRTVTTTGGRVVDTAGKPQTYEVQSGDTLIGIARKLDTSIDQLARDNDLKPPYNIRPGQVLKGPATTTKAYVVESGDTLYAIARRFGVSAQSVAEANEIELSTPIRVGQRIALPPGFKDAGPTVRTVTTQVPVAPSHPPVQTAATPAPARTATAATLQPTPAPVQTAQAAPPPAAPAPAAATPAPRPTPALAPTATRPSTPPAATGGRTIIDTNAPPTDNEVASAGQGRFIWPVRGEVISAFGPKGVGQRNDGLNVRAASGTAVRAAAAGEVVYAGDQVPGFGNLVLVKHEDGWVTAYAHLSRVDVKMRQQVTQGQTIGQVGASGGVSESQLHFEVRYAPTPKDKARPINPELVLPRS